MVWEELLEDIISKNLGIKHHNEENHESHDESSDQDELSEMVHSLAETDKKVASVELDLSEIVEKLIPSSESSISHENGESEEGEEGNEGSEGSGSNESGEQGGNSNENGSNEGNEGSNELSTETISINGTGSYTASDDVAETFKFTEGNYEYTIENFDLQHDVLDLPDEPEPTVINSGNNWDKDGEVTVQWAGDGKIIQVHLVGLTQDEDSSLWFASDLGDALA